MKSLVGKIFSSVDLLCWDVFTFYVIMHKMLFDVDELSSTCRGRSFSTWMAAGSSTEMGDGLVEAK